MDKISLENLIRSSIMQILSIIDLGLLETLSIARIISVKNENCNDPLSCQLSAEIQSTKFCSVA